MYKCRKCGNTNKISWVDRNRQQAILDFATTNSIQGEVWKEFSYGKGVKHTNLWLISNLGRVCKNFKIYYGCKKKDGYMYLGNMKAVHRIVAEAFIGKTEEDIMYGRNFVDHINAKRDDNRAVNLRWCTTKENNNFSNKRKNRMFGEKNPNYKKKSYNSNKVLYNNGIESHYFIINEQPDGYVKGRVKASTAA